MVVDSLLSFEHLTRGSIIKMAVHVKCIIYLQSTISYQQSLNEHCLGFQFMTAEKMITPLFGRILKTHDRYFLEDDKLLRRNFFKL